MCAWLALILVRKQFRDRYACCLYGYETVWPLSLFPALMAYFRLSVLDLFLKRLGLFQKFLRNPAIRRYDLRLYDMKSNSLLHKMARFR